MKAPTDLRRLGEAACFQPHSQSSLRPEEQAGGAGQRKSESACSALTGIRRTGEVAFFATQPV
ncbi:hypothetical protein [Planococcus soli]|uniref:hypothetical protein n=1 Tax=Planococcus soli TaxID=2666072 RepID=UPI00115E7B54|nr:hypothetical protein [Planococcus soli]